MIREIEFIEFLKESNLKEYQYKIEDYNIYYKLVKNHLNKEVEYFLYFYNIDITLIEIFISEINELLKNYFSCKVNIEIKNIKF